MLMGMINIGVVFIWLYLLADVIMKVFTMHMARSVNRVHRKSADRVHLVHPSSPPPPQHQILFLCTRHFFPSVRGRPCWYERNHGHGRTEKRASPSVRVGMNVTLEESFASDGLRPSAAEKSGNGPSNNQQKMKSSKDAGNGLDTLSESQ